MGGVTGYPRTAIAKYSLTDNAHEGLFQEVHSPTKYWQSMCATSLCLIKKVRMIHSWFFAGDTNTAGSLLNSNFLASLEVNI
jgi:hypothetical protein